MAIISQETFDNLDEVQKRTLRKMYLTVKEAGLVNKTELIESIFDKSCFENMAKDMKTWDDVIIFYPLMNQRIISDLVKWCDEQVYKKLDATAKIAKIIEFGYGGLVTEEENTDREENKYVIAPIEEDDNSMGFEIYPVSFAVDRVIAFHTKELAEEFISYPENLELVEQYYMI